MRESKRCFGIMVVVCFFLSLGFYFFNGQQNIWKLASQKEGEGGMLTNGTIAKKRVYLTFDDGPSVHTDEILDILKKHDVKATFFVIGKKTETARKQYQRIVLEGHTLGMHSYSHNYDQIYSSLEGFQKDLKQLETLLINITDIKPFAYRFPGGSSNTCAKDMKPYIAYVEKKGLKYYDWNSLSGDALDFTVSPEQLNENILKDVRRQDVSIVLMHDLAETTNTVKSLDSLIQTLKKEGYQILPITKNTKEIQHLSVDK